MYGSILIVSRCFDRGPLYFDRQVASQFNIVTFNVFFVVVVVVFFFLAFFPTDLGGKTADAYPMEWRAHVTNNIFMTLYKTSNASQGGEIFYHVGYITPGHVAVFGRATLSAPGAKKRRGYTKSLVVGTTQEFFVQESRGW